MTRKEFLELIGGMAASAAIVSDAPANAAAAPSHAKIWRGVSLYSYQALIYTGLLTMEECIAEASCIGAYGLEIVADAHVPNYPNPPEKWVEQWHGWMKKYKTVPVSYLQSQDTTIHPGEPLAAAEGAAYFFKDIECASRLGFTNMRIMGATPLDVVERCVPAADKYKISLNFEIHSTNPINGPLVEIWVKFFEKMKSNYLGINPDFSLFENKPPRVIRDQIVRAGVEKADVVQYIDKAHADGVPRNQAVAQVEKMGGSRYGLQYLTRRYGTNQDPKLLLPLKQYLHNMHGKIYEMTPDYHEVSLPYEEVMPLLVQNGFEFCVDTEYEGQRFIMDAEQEDEVEQVRRHQLQLKRLLGA